MSVDAAVANFGERAKASWRTPESQVNQRISHVLPSNCFSEVGPSQEKNSFPRAWARLPRNSPIPALLLGTALRLIVDNPQNQAALDTALDTLVRVLDAVDWNRISKGNADAWLYFYEDFLGVYDNKLRKLTGSYYTPPEVVSAMVSLVDEALRSRFHMHAGLTSPTVTLADPATSTGTFFLGALKNIVDTVKEDQGEGAVPGAVADALQRLIAFEMQLGPFAVAQLRILAEVVSLTGKPPKHRRACT